MVGVSHGGGLDTGGSRRGVSVGTEPPVTAHECGTKVTHEFNSTLPHPSVTQLTAWPLLAGEAVINAAVYAAKPNCPGAGAGQQRQWLVRGPTPPTPPSPCNVPPIPTHTLGTHDLHAACLPLVLLGLFSTWWSSPLQACCSWSWSWGCHPLSPSMGIHMVCSNWSSAWWTWPGLEAHLPTTVGSCGQGHP